jgi:hypothetical protein
MDETVIEQEVEQEVEKLPELSLRDQLSEAITAAKEPKEEPITGREADKVEKLEKTISKDGKPRDDTGKFAKQVQKTDTVEPPAPVIPDIPIPKGYSKTVETAWKDLPPAIKQELQKRDQDYHRELTKHDEERATGRQFKDVVNPYMAQIRAEGGDPIQAVQNFFNIAHILRHGTPQQKAQILFDTARQFNVDINQAQQTQPRIDPVVGQLQQTVQQLQQKLQNQEQAVKQQTQSKLVELVNTFASDTANYPHFSSVEQEMMALLQGGMFKDDEPAERLKKVYDYAVHANPQTRSTLIQTATQQSLEQRVADKKAKAEAARKAGSSIKGKPGMAAPHNQNPGGSLRDQLRSNWSEAREA